MQLCRLREWDLYRGQDIFQLSTRQVRADFTYAIALPKCYNDIVRV